nr:reverse transcriptase domain-containing protein [Tanacetum cinerariifolium]
TMADQRTMTELLRAPTKGYAEAIVVPPILAEHFELMHNLINMMTSDQFSGLEKDNPHDHIRCFQQRFNESCHEAWDRYKFLLRVCPHHGFTELHQLDTFYNALNPNDQESLNSAAGGNLLERCTQDVLMIIENKSKVRNSRNKLIVSQVKSSDANSSSSYECANKPPQGNTIAHPKGELKAITTRSCLVLDGSSVPMPPPFINPEEDERVKETLIDPKLGEYTIKKVLKALLSNKKKLLKLANTPLNENCSAVILNKLPEKLRDLGKFLILCGFSELKCKALADLGASINLMPLSVWKKIGLPELNSTRMTLELANRAICTPARIARHVFVQVGKFTFLANFVIVDYESDPRVPLISGRPFLQTSRALIDVHEEEMILRDGDERLTLNLRHDTSSYSNQPQKESINMINIYNDSCKDYFEYLFAINHLSGNPTFSSHIDLTSPEVINPLSGSTTSSSPNHLLEEFADELALITFPPGNDDLPFDIDFDLREIEYFLNHDPTKEMDYILKDSVDEYNLADPNDNLVDTIPEMFTDEHTLNYSSLPLYDDFDNDLFKLESDNDDIYDDPFDSKEDKINEFKLLIDELDPPRSRDFLPSPKYDSFLFEDFSEVYALPSTNNEDKVFNPGILIHKNLTEVTVQVTPDKNEKKMSISNASLILKDFDPPFYELPFHKEVLGSETLLSFTSQNEEKNFKPEILTSKGVHTSLLSELSHRGPKVFKVIKIFESTMKIFRCSYGEDIRI